LVVYLSDAALDILRALPRRLHSDRILPVFHFSRDKA